MESLKAFIAEVRGVGVDVKNKIIRLIGKSTWEDEPTLDMEEISNQVANITGESASSTPPVVSLKDTKAHIDQDISLSEAAHGITGFSVTAADLGTSGGGAASDKTVSRGNHVHKMPTAANVGAMSISHPANSITGFGTSAAALGTSNGGSSTLVSKADHVHQMPTAAQVGALSDSSAAGDITGFSTTASALGASSGGSSTTVSRGNHVHALPTASQVGAVPSTGGTFTGAIEVNGGIKAYGIVGRAGSSPLADTGNLINIRWTGSRADLYIDTSLHGSIQTTTQLSNSNPTTIGGTASPGISSLMSRADHVHPFPLDISARSYVAQNTINQGYRFNSTDNDDRGMFLTTENILYFICNSATFRNISANFIPISASAFTVNSDPSLKKNIVRGWTNPTDINIQEFAYNAVITFHFSHEDDDSPKHHGFDASLIQQYSPRASVLLDGPEDGVSTLGVDVVAIVAYLTQVIADQDRRIEKLEKQINSQ